MLLSVDKHRRLKIRTNADTPEDARRARELGEKHWTCRTEHMFFEADRIRQMRAMILRKFPEERAEALDGLFFQQRRHVGNLSRNGRSGHDSIVDPPSTNLPNTPPTQPVADNVGKSVEKIEAIIENLEEVNPMLVSWLSSVRGVSRDYPHAGPSHY